MHINTKNGGLGELAIKQKFLSLGCMFFEPGVEGYPTDLVVKWDGEYHQIQIKTTEKIKDDVMSWELDRYNHQSYTKDDVDYFALYCLENSGMYLVPFEEAPNQKIKIRLDSYSGKRTKTMRFESDYKFENYVK